MKPTEQLAILTAIKKAVDERIKHVRTDVDDHLKDAYDDDGIEKIALKVGGIKVGEILVTYQAEGFAITDREAFNGFALDYGLGTIKRTIRPDMMETCIKALESVFEPEVLAEAVQDDVILSKDWEKSMTPCGGMVAFMDTGVVVPGMVHRPKAPKGTMVRGCKPDDVLPILRELPGGVEQLLLGDPDE